MKPHLQITGRDLPLHDGGHRHFGLYLSSCKVYALFCWHLWQAPRPQDGSALAQPALVVLAFLFNLEHNDFALVLFP